MSDQIQSNDNAMQTTTMTDKQAQAIANKMLFDQIAKNNLSRNVGLDIGREYIDSVTQNQHNYFADLSLVIPELSDDATEQERQHNEELINRKALANSILGAVQYNLGTKDIKDDIQEFAKFYGEKAPWLTKEQIELMYSQKAEQNWFKVFDKYGLIKEDLLTDCAFASSISPQTYEKLAIAKNMTEGTWSLTRGYQQYKYARPLNLALQDGKISYEEYKQKMQMVDSMFKGQDDSESWFKVGGIVSGMVQPIVDNPVQSTVGAIAGIGVTALTRSPSLGFATFSAIALGQDTFQQQQAQSMLAVYEKDPDNYKKYSREKILAEGFTRNIAGTALDIFDDALTIALVGAGKLLTSPIKALWKNRVTQGIEKAAADIEAMETQAVAGKKVRDIVGNELQPMKYKRVAAAVLGAGAVDYGKQVVTEGIQDALAQDVAESLAGTPLKERLANDWNTAYQTIKDSLGPMGILSLGMHSPKLAGSLINAHKANAQLEKFLDMELGIETVADDPTLTPDTIDTVLQQRVYINKARVDKLLQDNNMTVDDLGTEFKSAYDRAQNGDAIRLSSGNFSKLSQDKRVLLASIATDREGALYPEWVREYLGDQEIDRIRQLYHQQEQAKALARQEREVIETDIYNQLINANLNSKKFKGDDYTKASQTIAKMYSAFYQALSKATGKSITDLYNQHQVTIHKFDGDATKAPKSLQDNKNYGAYDYINRAIYLKDQSDFASIFHESTHFFFDTLLREADTSINAELVIDELAVPYGESISSIKNDPKAYEKVQEAFAHGFIQYLINGGQSYQYNRTTGKKELNPNAYKMFATFKSFLSSLKNSSLFNGNAYNESRQVTGESKGEFINKGFKNLYGFDLNTNGNTFFEDAVSSMFESELTDNILNIEYPYDEILHTIDSSDTFDDVTKQTLKDELHTLIESLQAGQTEAINALYVNDLILKLQHAEDIQNFLINAIENSTPEINQTVGAKRIAKAKALLEDYTQLERELKEKYTKNKLQHIKFINFLAGIGPNLTDINRTQILADNSLSQQDIKRLKDKGFVVSKRVKADTAQFSFDEIAGQALYRFSQLSDTEKAQIESVFPRGNRPDIEWAKDFLINAPTTEEYATLQAKQQMQARVQRLKLEDRSALKVKLAKLHNQLAKAFMAKLQEMTKGSKATKAYVDSINEKIEKAAELDALSTVYSEANSQKYYGNARLANKHTQQAIARGQLEDEGLIQGAISSTRDEMYQTHKAEFIESQKMRITKHIDKLKKFVSTSDKRLKDRYDTDIVDVMRLVLGRVGIGKYNQIEISNINFDDLRNTYPLAQPLLDSIERVAKAGLEGQGNINQTLQTNTKFNNHFSQMTLGDLSELLDLMEDLKYVARSQMVMHLNGKTVSLNQKVQQGLQVLSKEKDRNLTTIEGDYQGSKSNKSIWHKTLEIVKDYMSLNDTPETRMQILDGTVQVTLANGKKVIVPDTDGVFHQIYQRVRDGNTNYQLQLNDLGNRLSKAFNSLPNGSIKKKPVYSELRIRGKDGQVRKWAFGLGEFKNKTTLELMGLLMNMGTNYDKLVDGYLDTEYYTQMARQEYGVKEPTYEQILNTKKKEFHNFIQQCIDNGDLTEDIFRVVEEMHAINKSLEPQLQAAAKETRGYGFKRIEECKDTFSFKGKDKSFTFGYMPLVKNDELTDSQFNDRVALAENINKTMAIAGLKEPSALQERSKVTYPLCLDPVGLIGKTKDVVRYINILPAISEADKFFNHTEIANMLDRKFPNLRDQVINPWLISVATMKTSTPSTNKFLNSTGNFLNRIVRSTAGTLMVGNINNVLQQVSNLPTVCTKVNPNILMQWVGHTVWGFAELRDDVMNQSPFMRLRMAQKHNSQEIVMQDLAVDYRMFDDTIEKAKAAAKAVANFQERNAYFAQKYLQDRLDTVVWCAAKEQALRDQKNRGQPIDDQKAIHFADMVVRTTLGSFDISDTAKIAKSNPWAKAFSMFGSYFYTMYRLNELQLRLVTKQYGANDPRRYLHYVYQTMLCTIAPAMIAEIINQAVGSGDLWSDDDDTFDNAMTAVYWSPVKMAASAFPVIGKVVNDTIDEINGKNFYASAMLSQPWLTSIQSTITVLKKGWRDDTELTSRDYKVIANMASILSGQTFLGMFARPITYAQGLLVKDEFDYSKYDNDLTKSIEIVRGLITGKASSDTKK